MIDKNGVQSESSNRAVVFSWLTLDLPNEISPSIATDAMPIDPSIGFVRVEWDSRGSLAADSDLNQGNNRHSNGDRAQQLRWRLELKEKLVTNVDQAIKPIVGLLLSHDSFVPELIRKNKARGEVGLAIYTFESEGMPSLSFDPKLISDLANLGVSVDIDFYHMGGKIPSKWLPSSSD